MQRIYRWKPGEGARPDPAGRSVIEVAYARIPDLSFTLARQAYTRIAPGRVLYEGLGSDFQAELDVDENDLVVRYPGLFERVAT
jgi:uncharacterized protein